jgi:predicted ATPase
MALKLEEIYVNNYKSFHHTTIRLDDFNIIVGANNAGKSNLVDLLEFIQIALRENLIVATKLKGGVNKIRNFRSDDDFIEIKIKFKNSSSHVRGNLYIPELKWGVSYDDIWHVHFRISEGIKYQTGVKLEINSKFRMIDEDFDKLMGEIDSADKKLRDWLKDEGYIKFEIDLEKNIEENDLDQHRKIHSSRSGISYSTGEPDVSINIRSKNKDTLTARDHILILEQYYLFSHDFYEKAIDNKMSVEELLNSVEEKTNFDSFVNHLFRYQNIETFNLDVNAIRRVMKTPESMTLKKSGENLHYILEKLKRTNNVEKETFENISSALVGIVDEVEEVEVQMQPMGTDKVPEIIFKESKGFAVAREDISDGTLSLLAILTGLYLNPEFSFLRVFEEPERHLHLKAVSYLMDIFRDYAKERQVAITSQSSEVLRNIHIDSDYLVFIYRDREGYTKSLSSRDIREIKALIDQYDYSIDEIIRHEILGDLSDYEEKG